MLYSFLARRCWWMQSIERLYAKMYQQWGKLQLFMQRVFQNWSQWLEEVCRWVSLYWEASCFFLSDIFQHANCHLMLTAASEASERAIELSNTSVRRILFVQLPRTYFSLLICKEGKAQVEKDFFRHIGSTASNNGIYLWYYCSLHFAAKNPCSSDHGCEHVCFQGSSNEATCACFANYELDSNEKNCTGKLLIFFFNLKELVVDRSQCFFWNEN